MILSCPQCHIGYFVDDGLIKAGGRTVHCTACDLTWTAPAAVADPAPGPAASQAQLETPDEDYTRPKTAGSPPVHKTFRARVGLRQRWREAAFSGVVAGTMAVALGLSAGWAVVFREDVVRALPGAAGAYAALGLPVNRIGLVIEAVRAEPTLQDGHAALAVSGVIHNVADRAVASPPLRIALLNTTGRRVDGRLATAPNLSIPAGSRRRFAVAILDPPLSAANLEIAFAPGEKPGASPARPMTAALPSPGPLALKGPLDPEASPTPVAEVPPAAANSQS